jgi:hypothetical protein
MTTCAVPTVAYVEATFSRVELTAGPWTVGSPLMGQAEARASFHAVSGRGDGRLGFRPITPPDFDPSNSSDFALACG